MDKLSQKHEKKAMDFLNADANFKAMTEDQKRILAGACTVQTFGRGEQILREGEVGDCLSDLGGVQIISHNRPFCRSQGL